MAAPFARNPSVLAEQLVIGAVPVRIGDDGARKPHDIAQRIDEHVGTVEQPPQPAHRGMHHDHVAGAKAKLLQILAEREAGVKVRSGHGPTIIGSWAGVNLPVRTFKTPMIALPCLPTKHPSHLSVIPGLPGNP